MNIRIAGNVSLLLLVAVGGCSQAATTLPLSSTASQPGASSGGPGTSPGGAQTGGIPGVVPERLATGLTPAGWTEWVSGDGCRVAAPPDWKADPDLGTGPKPADQSVFMTVTSSYGGVETFSSAVSQARAGAAPAEIVYEDERLFLKRSDPLSDVLELVGVVETAAGYCFIDLTIVAGNVDARLPTVIQILETFGGVGR